MTTPILQLDEWVSAQAQPEATVNAALRWLEAFSPLVVQSISTNTPPAGTDGLRYIVGTSPTGVWVGHAKQVALYLGTSWAFKTAAEGTAAWVLDVAAQKRYTGGSWV